MAASLPKSLIHELERQAIVIALREHPEWALADLFARMSVKDRRAAALRVVTLRELMKEPTGPPVRLAIARRAYGAAFDEIVHRVLVDAGRPVGASFLRGCLGGPRWKLQASLGRLVDAGLVIRSGITSNTLYQGVWR